jgi:hypothetical protein
MFALYWDESDPNDPDALKLRRSIYASFDEAMLQANSDLECIRCRIDEEGKQNIRLRATGKEPLDLKKSCIDCKGTKICPSRNILYIEDLGETLTKEFFAEAKLASNQGAPTPAFTHGKRVWTREN